MFFHPAITAMIILYTICHFLVDFGSGWSIYHGAAYSAQGWLAVVLYNFIAFALQFPLGFLVDAHNRNAVLATAGCLLVALACVMPGSPWIIVSVAGLGNALFHLGAGVEVLNSCPGKYGPLGIFVSTGAFGIAYGCQLGTGLPQLGGTCALILGLATLCIAVWQRRTRHSWSSHNTPFAWPAFSAQYAMIALCLFTVVCLRSYLGFALSLPWKTVTPWGTAALVALFAGKFCGELIADRCGVIRTSSITLTLAALLFVFSGQPWAGLSAIWLFNMTMPITLGALVTVTPGCKGAAFGLLTLGLFLGALPHLLDCDPLPHSPSLYVLVTLVSLCLLLIALSNSRPLTVAGTSQPSQELPK